ncbi:hypothetical protein QFC22_003609 [Naganishia vaughanmartiniae]|uniref:Uncharacterized protein n=1 Tax=Naganishia vaughanmartiniae TaxID=1424756 RepID=A0ACC2X671_9TREE|nr:hypothetical protein QFC22_003609 [Naganishia vaughanmartiniae]
MIIPPDKKEAEYRPPSPGRQSSQLVTSHGSLPPDVSEGSFRSANPEEAAPSDNTHTPAVPQSHGGTPGRRILQDEEFNEESPLLPPSYSEAVSQSGKNTRSKRRRYLLLAMVVVLLLVGGAAVMALVRRSRERESARGWKRGGLDGKGKYDHRWQHSTPLLDGEIQPRECDLFSEPRLIDSWRNGATARPIYESFTEFMIPLQDDKISLQKFWLHVRGSRANGLVQVTGPGTEITEFDRPPPGKLKVVVRVTAQNTTGLNDWHVCKAGSVGEEGVVITGLYDGKRPVVSPWLEGYTRFVVAVIFPHDIDFPGAKRHDHLLESMSMNLENMAVDVRGDFLKPGLAKDLNVLTKNAGVVVNSLAVVDARIETKNANLAVQHIFARDTIALINDNGNTGCAQCIANSSFLVVHNDNGKVTGDYKAGLSIDVVTAREDVDAAFSSPRVWVKSESANVRANVSGIEGKNGALMLLTSFGRIVTSIDFAHLRRQSARKGYKVPIRLGTSGSDIEATISHLPPDVGLAIEAEVTDGIITIIAPDQLQSTLDLTAGVIDIDLGTDEQRANKKLTTDRFPFSEGKYKGPLHGALTYRRPGSGIPLAMSSLALICTELVRLVL